MDIDLPGFKKDEVKVELKDGYLTVSAAKGLDKDESDKKGKFLRQERYAGSMSRSFYVGDDVESADVSAKFEDGILKISVPKAAPKELPKHTTITIAMQARPGQNGRGALLFKGISPPMPFQASAGIRLL